MAESSGPRYGNPAPLGLICFGLTTIMLSSINAGLLPPAGLAVVIPLALMFGGTAQVIAGVLEFLSGNTFGQTAFVAYGAFWWWFAVMLIFNSKGVVDLKGADSTIGVCLLAWGVFSLYMWIATFKLNRALWLIFLTLWITFFLLGFGEIMGSGSLHTAGGYLGIVCALLAIYTSFAGVTNSTAGRDVLPLGPFKK
jgi:succinate-acetate transporter protein